MKKIVILGAGFGGLRAAIKISKKLRSLQLLKDYEVVLIDRNDHHTYTPLLYEVATTSKSLANIAELHEVAAYKIKPLIKNLSLTFLQKEVTAADLIRGEVILGGKEKILADYLVIALGAEVNYFDIPGLASSALALKTFTDAIRIRDSVWNLGMAGEENIKILVVGGGATGVELASELKVWCGELEKEFRKCELEVAIIEAGRTILPGFDTRVIKLVEKRLKRVGVKIFAHESLTRVEKKKAYLTSGRIEPFDILIWAGGIKAAEALSKLPLKNEARGRVVVRGKMECLPQTPDLKFRSKVYGLGDTICFYDPRTEKPIPSVARAAISQANVVSENIIEDIKMENGLTKTADHKVYKSMEYPYITPVGGKYAVAKIGPLVVAGFWGWILKGLVELNYLFSIMPRWTALRLWLKGLKIFTQNDRLG
ncbi:MAG: FAD-dependent oxidoreductase [Candidatus Liptonbacteria bacterium]|nr:FAD-dependent oxidoreductase [Candidatus Liptonbacteria bacterium]